MTSTELTERRHRFRHDIIARSGDSASYVSFWDDSQTHCDAAHIIPRNKGDDICIAWKIVSYHPLSEQHAADDELYTYNEKVHDFGISRCIEEEFDLSSNYCF